MKLILLGSVLPPGDYPDDIATKGFTDEGTIEALKVHNLPESITPRMYADLPSTERAILEVKLIEEEFQIVKNAYPEYDITELKPSYCSETNKITYPKLVDYLNKISEKLADTKHGMLGIFYTGAAQLGTGSWVVPDDKGICVFSMQNLFEFMRELKWTGQLWMHIDCPHAGYWVLDMYKDHKKYADVISNAMIDVSCDQFNTPDWLVHLVIYKDRDNLLWTKANPTGFTMTYSSAAWPNPGKSYVIVKVPYPN